MEPSVFTRIVQGEIPCHKIYEDDTTLAFLDIHPALPGHVLVIPKKQVNRLEDLEDSDYAALMSTTKKVMKRLVDVNGEGWRACLRVVGFDVPHAHVHVIPCRNGNDFWTRERMDIEPDHPALAEMAKKLAF